MPLYEYRCSLCFHVVEKYQTVLWRDSPDYCAVCATERNQGTPLSTAKLERVLTPAHLHGSPNMPND